MIDMFACAEKWYEVYRRTESGREGDLKSDAFQNLGGESGEGGSTGLASVIDSDGSDGMY